MADADRNSSQKDENYWKVLDAVIRLEVNKGHLMWKITDLARASDVARPLIYYYFGKSKEEIVQAALKIIGDEFFGLSEERIEMWRGGDVVGSVLKTRTLMEKAPYVPVFFFHWRHQPGEISSHLKDLEDRYRAKIALLRPDLSGAQIEGLFATFFGLVLFPNINEQTIRFVIKATGL
ncbi:TetR/AcrR family transcriptional regulator [bacterium]|nr:TetR/AcrR family transcriptional regulator [bacterium]